MGRSRENIFPKEMRMSEKYDLKAMMILKMIKGNRIGKIIEREGFK